MNRRAIHTTVLLILISAAVVAIIQKPAVMNAREAEDSNVYLSLIRSRYAPRLKKFVTVNAPQATFTAIVDPGDGRFFIATRDGLVRISAREGAIQPQPLLDIRDKVYDDGNGPALFVGGAFTQAGGSPARYIAKWSRPPPPCP